MKRWFVCFIVLLASVAATAQSTGPGKTKATVSQAGINLAWQMTGCNSCTFNVYRGTTPGGESTTALATTPAGTLTYLDASGTGGQIYYYVVTATLNGREGPKSNEASATFPFVPGSPSGLTATPQ